MYFNCSNCIKWVLFILLVFFLSLNFFDSKNIEEPQPIQNVKHVKIGGVSVAVELALNPASQAQGLSGRNQLGKNEGMLFVFDRPDQYAFWMKDMNFPIDIIWIGEDLQIVYIKKNAAPESYPETFTPEIKAKYVLEVISGFSEKNNLKERDRVLFF